jgi:hypothetical protein
MSSDAAAAGAAADIDAGSRLAARGCRRGEGVGHFFAVKTCRRVGRGPHRAPMAQFPGVSASQIFWGTRPARTPSRANRKPAGEFSGEQHSTDKGTFKERGAE